MPTDDFLTRYIGTERTLRSVSIRNRLLTITKTWTYEGSIDESRHAAPWVIDLNAIDSATDESLVLQGMWLAQFDGAAQVTLFKNEVQLVRADGGVGTASGTYLAPQWFSYASQEPDNDNYTLVQGDVLRPVITGVIGVAGHHLSVTVVLVHYPAT